jgi:hypothetical protein
MKRVTFNSEEERELLSDDEDESLIDEEYERTRVKEFTLMDLSDQARAQNLQWKSGRDAGRDHDIILAKAWLEDRQSSDEDDEEPKPELQVVTTPAAERKYSVLDLIQLARERQWQGPPDLGINHDAYLIEAYEDAKQLSDDDDNIGENGFSLISDLF